MKPAWLSLCHKHMTYDMTGSTRHLETVSGIPCSIKHELQSEFLHSKTEEAHRTVFVKSGQYFPGRTISRFLLVKP